MWVWSDYFLNLNKKWKLHFQLDESNPQAADRQGEDGEIVEAFSRCFYVTSSAMYLSTHGQACRRPRPNNAILFPLNDCLSQSANVTRSFSQFAKSWKKREGYTSMLKKKKKWIHVCIWDTMLCCVESLSHVPLFMSPWTVAHQAPLSMGILQTRILEWVAMPSSRGSSQPGDQTQISHITGWFFTIWATREVQKYWNG